MTEKKPTQPAKVVRPSLLSATFGERGKLFGSLFAANLTAGVLYLVQAVVLLAVAKSTSIPLFANYLTADPLQSAAQGKTVLTLARHQVVTVPILWVVFVALLFGAVVHMLLATRMRSDYEASVEQGNSGYRWLQFTVVPTLLLAAVGLSAGVQDVFILAAIIAASIALHMGCLLVERRSRPGEPVGRLLYGIGSLVGLLVIVLLIGPVKTAALYAQGYPSYDYYLVFSTVALCLLAALNFVLQRRAVGKWAKFAFGERLSIALGLVAASAVSWQIYGGLLH